MQTKRDSRWSAAQAATSRRNLLTGSARLAGGGALTLAGVHALNQAALAQDATPMPEATPGGEQEPWMQSPWSSWITAHMNDENPPDVIGGPITTTATQESGPAFWVFPGPRQLDPAVFGTPDDPRGTERPTLFLGVPMEMRKQSADGTWQTAVPTPFGNDFASTDGAKVRCRCVDATAIDGATTKDEIDFEATFQAPMDQGEYTVTVGKPAPHGWAYPTGGGVVTDVMLHGVTGWGTRLMPTEFTYSAFWGSGSIQLNGETIAEETGVHVMVTEFVRKSPYDLVFDEGVNPGLRHLHLMVLPFTLKGEPQPVPTGFMLPNGMEQPFLHVMFPALTIERTVGE